MFAKGWIAGINFFFLKEITNAEKIDLYWCNFILNFFFLTNGCFTKSLKDYEAKSPDEKAIMSMLIKTEQTWNNGDVEGNLALLHDDAKIMYGGGHLPH